MIVTGIFAAPARAQVVDKAEKEALRLNQRSRELYDQGRHAEAAELLRKAYRLKPVPILLFNLARACEAMDDDPCTVAAYESYLPHARDDERAKIEELLLFYRKRLATRPAPAAPSVQGEPPVQRAAPPVQQAAPPVQQVPPLPSGAPDQPPLSVLPPIAAAIGVTALGVGGVLAWQALETNDQSLTDVPPGASEKRARAEVLMTAGNATMIAGGVVAVAGVAWWILDRRASHRGSAAAQLHIGAGTVAISAAF